MVDDPWVLAVVTGLAGLVALLLTPTMKPFLEERTVWSRSRIHVPLAAIAGAGAAALAENPAELVAFAAAGVGGSLLTVIDLSVRRLPDVFVLATVAALLVPLGLAAAMGEEWDALGRSLLGAAVLLFGYLLLAMISPSGLGLGDVKFAAVIGAFLGWFGWSHVAAGTVFGFLLNGVIALLVLLSRRGSRDTDIPFGPSMVLGAICAVAVLS
ncbi:prepilin peptidase [Nesterenkonia lutea]|uniref:Leader peptidase (Prepilin peptidase)/N-methyltransferase n=1 Tax=Nesterenkonia lutea TaxID=272919 RepID=A0ABR9JGV4_9MICC|nr:A24 family peptidase [Nesterenkonia lutea]MBE1525170.1 leader peptidase (prepilin peptidase)/N-methyltransferase [Nesterenkonia lutea]